MRVRLTTEQFTTKAKAVHGDKYNYSKTIYKRRREKVTITCLIHGDFEQKAGNHLNGSGCSKCKTLNNSNKRTLTTEQFIKRAKKIHGDTYDYSKVKYTNNDTKIKIICHEHGVFEQRPYSHLRSSGCPICSFEKQKSNSKQFIEKAKAIHGDTYDYSLVDYKTARTKVAITCLIHGVFEQRPNSHLQGQGCPKCKNSKISESNKSGLTSFIEKANKIHKNLYSYKYSIYKKSIIKLKIYCKEHGIFEQTPGNHLQGHGCPKCSHTGPSKKEQELYNFINSLVKTQQSNKTVLDGKELDIYIPSKKLAIEFNGLYWHSDKFKEKNHLVNKTLECQNKGIRLIHIFEDEWDNKKEIVKSRLKNLLGTTENRIFARKCEIKEVPTKQAMQFLENNHIQGKLGAKVKLGLYFENELVSLITFGKLRKSLGSNYKKGSWELLRFCNKLNTTVIGGASKLLKHFQKNYEWKEIISYCDLRWSNGNLYNQLNFQELHRSNPNYFYFKEGYNLLENRFKYRKSELVRQGFDKNKTEKQIMKERGFLRIYDCGTIKFKMIK